MNPETCLLPDEHTKDQAVDNPTEANYAWIDEVIVKSELILPPEPSPQPKQCFLCYSSDHIWIPCFSLGGDAELQPRHLETIRRLSDIVVTFEKHNSAVVCSYCLMKIEEFTFMREDWQRKYKKAHSDDAPNTVTKHPEDIKLATSKTDASTQTVSVPHPLVLMHGYVPDSGDNNRNVEDILASLIKTEPVTMLETTGDIVTGNETSPAPVVEQETELQPPLESESTPIEHMEGELTTASAILQVAMLPPVSEPECMPGPSMEKASTTAPLIEQEASTAAPGFEQNRDPQPMLESDSMSVPEQGRKEDQPAAPRPEATSCSMSSNEQSTILVGESDPEVTYEGEFIDLDQYYKTRDRKRRRIKSPTKDEMIRETITLLKRQYRRARRSNIC